MRCEAIRVFPLGGLFDKDPVQAGSSERANGARNMIGRCEPLPVALVRVGEAGGFAIDRTITITADVEATAVVEAKVFDRGQKTPGLIGEDERDVRSQGVVKVLEAVQDGSAKGDAMRDDGPHVGCGVDPGLGVLAGAVDDARDAGGANICLGRVVIASHDHCVRDGTNVIQDFVELSFAPLGRGFDFQMVMNDREARAGKTWHEEIDSKEDAATIFEFALELAMNKDVSSEAADFFDRRDGLLLVLIPVVGLVLQRESGGTEDGLA